ncbi:hypothetical protein M0811_02048 [Anaeramoeba ignava]|uniref:Uncharacterized protein n=1 Tax=Anaeramoeba ignava TaxID=1746090 RepID=A0A9Q0R7M2_ANAIG|nr:hypothetical protein M0811_02048 [Anaeramoeba ignava]
MIYPFDWINKKIGKDNFTWISKEAKIMDSISKLFKLFPKGKEYKKLITSHTKLNLFDLIYVMDIQEMQLSMK